MNAWLMAIAVLAALALVAALAAWLAWRRSGPETRELIRRIARLSLRARLSLALTLAREPRIPLLVRAIPPAIVLYLAMPLDVIPDFIPVIGHADDVLIVVVGVGLLLRFTPRHVLDEHVARLEPPLGQPSG